MKTTLKDLINDIREYMRETVPFEYRNAYDTDADANEEISYYLQHEPETVIAFLADFDDSANLINRVKAATI